MSERRFFEVRWQDLALVGLVILSGFAISVCSGGVPDVPPVEPAPATTTAAADPEPKPEPTPVEPVAPPDEPAQETASGGPGNYISMRRIDGILNGTSSQSPGLIAEAQFMAWAGWRDPHNVATYCNTSAPYIGTTDRELTAFGNRGQQLTQEAETVWIPRWQRAGPNRRCEREPDPLTGPGWCDVTDVNKNGPWKAFKDEFDSHLQRASMFRTLAGRCRGFLVAHGGSDYDSIAGWCGSMRRAGVDAGACPP